MDATKRTTEVREVSIERKVRDLEILLEVTKALQVERDLDRLLGLVVESTTQVIDAERSTLFVLDRERDCLTSKIAQGAETTEIRVGLGQGIAGTVAKTGEVVNILDAYNDSRFNPEVDRKTGFSTRSILCVPLINHEGEPVGVIQALNKRGGAFSAYDEDLLTAFAAHAAIALDNARLIGHFLEKQRIQATLNVAREIQLSLLPEREPEVDRFEFSGHSKACDETGGDYYDFLPLGEGRWGVVIGDVTGHGVGSALLMAAARATLRSVALEADDVREVVTKLNRSLAVDMGQGRFMTLFYGILETATGRMTYVNAGHDEPLLLRRSTGRFEALEATGIPVGLFGDYDYGDRGEIEFGSGDLLCLQTDGIWEATDMSGEQFGKERLRGVLREGAGCSAAEVLEAISEAVESFCGDATQRDDLTLVLVRAKSDA